MDLIPIVEKLVKRTAEHRTNVPRMLDWIEINPDRFREILYFLDEAVKGFNTNIASGDIPSRFIALNNLRSSFNTQRLPTVFELSNGTRRTTYITFARAVFTMSEMMKRGEEGETAGSYLNFHTMQIDPEALVIGGVLHVYEEVMKRSPSIAPLFVHGLLVDGLVEVIILQREENILYPAVAHRDRLNWVAGWQGFSKEIRNELGFS